MNGAKITTGNSIATSLKHIYSLANRTMHHKIYSDGSRCTQMKGREGGGELRVDTPPLELALVSIIDSLVL